MAITKQDFEEMLKKIGDLIKNTYIESSDKKEHKITLQELTGNMDNLEKRSLEVILKKTNLGDEETFVVEKIANVCGFELILRKKVKSVEMKEEEKDAKTISKWICDIINRGSDGIIGFWNKENKDDKF